MIHSLRIKIYQPTAHFRLPFAYQRRHTYPLPPYSTVIGFLCNLLGIDYKGNDIFEKLKSCKLSVSGRFGTKTTEYIWFRNLSKEAHIKYFGTVNNRTKNGEVQHIGGQSPMRIDVLDDNELYIHIAQEDNKTDFLEYIKENLYNPINRLEVLHLGRAEDWVVFKDVDIVKLNICDKHKNYRHFFWIPRENWQSERELEGTSFDKAEGLFYNLPVFATIKDYDKTFNRHGQRSFSYLRVKLNDGTIKGLTYYLDKDISGNEIPVFFADLSKSN